jgi:glycine oxidase
VDKPSSSFDVAVVGGGAIGLTVAWRAAQRGLRVVVLERDEFGGGASWVAAGMLAPVTEATLSEQAVLRLGLASAQGYPAFVEELHRASGTDPGYLPWGMIVVARDRDEAEALDRELEMRRRLGLPVSRLRPSEARALEPAIAPVLRLALVVPDDHAIDPRALVEALAVAVERAGGALRSGAPVASVQVEHDRVGGVVLASGETVQADNVVVAAGVWAGRLGGLPADALVPLRPVKGQILFLRDPAGPGLLERVLRTSDGYVVPRGDGRYVLGATMEERGFDTTVTAGAVFSLLRDASELLPSISELTIEELVAGLRPATPDSAPAIGPGAIAGLHWATGHYRKGVLLTPITADLVIDGIVGEPVDERFGGAFSPRRFAHTSVTA